MIERVGNDEGYLPEQNKIMLSKCDFVFICLYPHAILDFLKKLKHKIIMLLMRLHLNQEILYVLNLIVK